jgi:hypothetical protein
MKGQIRVSVYDMQGRSVDQFSLEAVPQSRHSYHLSGQKSGIYLFVFNYNGNIVTKRIILTN